MTRGTRKTRIWIPAATYGIFMKTRRTHQVMNMSGQKTMMMMTEFPDLFL